MVTAAQWQNEGWRGGGNPWFDSLIASVNGRFGSTNFPAVGSRPDQAQVLTGGGSARRSAEKIIAAMEYSLPFFSDASEADENGRFSGMAGFPEMNKAKFRERTAGTWDWERWDAGERGWWSLGDLFGLAKEYGNMCRWINVRGLAVSSPGRIIEVEKNASGTIKWVDGATSYHPFVPWGWPGVQYYYWTSNVFSIAGGDQAFGYGARLAQGGFDMVIPNSEDYRFDATVDLYSGGFGDGNLRYLSSTALRIGHLAGRWNQAGEWPIITYSYETGKMVDDVWVPGTEDFARKVLLWSGNTSQMDNVWAVVKIGIDDDCPWQI
jgi:hypothetical protein